MMSLQALVHKMRLIVPTGAIVFTMVSGLLVAHHVHDSKISVTAPTIHELVDGSESTGKPPKPKGRMDASKGVPTLLADGSESTGKPPKPKGRIQIADGSESTSKPPKPKKLA